MIDFTDATESTEVDGFPVPFGVLPDAERREREECETVFRRESQSFIALGDALSRFRVNRLYRETHDTFESYCQDELDWTRGRVNQLIRASEVVANLDTIVSKPSSESVVRPLCALEPEQQREAWQRAVETAPDGRVTAAHVESIAREYRDPDDVEEETSRDWTLDDAAEYLRAKLYEISQRWPREHLEVMGRQLRSLGEELIKRGELPH